MRDIEKIIIHCAATRPSADVSAKDIDQWHRARGFLKIGYHHVIRRDGTIEMGSPITEAGAHAKRHTKTSIGICMVGGVMDDGKTPDANFTRHQWAALDRLVAEYEEQYPDAKIIGHREVSPKACPSFDVQLWLGT
jgi:N-acetyl-anhydromuramyl-L-alanine amidase AmpD